MLILQRIRILEAQANIDVCPTYVRSEHNLPTLHHVGNRGTNHLPHLYTSHPPLPTTSHTMSSLIDDHIRAALDILQSRTRPATTPTPSSVTSPALASISTRTHNPTTPRPPRPHLTTRALPPAVSRPDVPAAQRLLAWIPSNRPQLPPFHDPERVSRTLMASWAKSTLDSYASAVLQWYAWATAVDLPEQLIFPIKPRTLVDFIANSAGIYNGKTISKWVSGLRAYHIIHGAHLKSQDETVKQALRGAARQTPATAIKPPRIPYTAAILIALRPAFHLGDPFDAAVWVC
ncbi:unnamed protein product [Tilletia laevis]|nr:unnamed protein product [Tilletia laevis]CAD7062381.1 unnamed protein product [Tilletia caries]